LVAADGACGCVPARGGGDGAAALFPADVAPAGGDAGGAGFPADADDGGVYGAEVAGECFEVVGFDDPAEGLPQPGG
jgi:hypothetical protein